jgi:hypothetical protein
MKKLFTLLLVGFFGYMTYPLLHPKPSEASKDKADNNIVKEADRVGKPEEVTIIPVETVIRQSTETKKIGSHKMVVKEEITEIIEENKEIPKKEEVNLVPDLDEIDLKNIITNEVEAGGRIDFRKDNIISWELKEQGISKQGTDYLGEIGIEVGTLFGAELRRAKLLIQDKKITSWEWIAVELEE